MITFHNEEKSMCVYIFPKLACPKEAEDAFKKFMSKLAEKRNVLDLQRLMFSSVHIS